MKFALWARYFSDSAEVYIEESPGQLAIRCKVTASRFGWIIPIGFFVIWTVFAFRSGGWPWLCMGIIALVTWVWHWWEPVHVQLMVTHRGLETRGNFGGGYRPVPQMVWSDVYSIQYRSGSGGEDDYSPAGLWALGRGVSTCLLPGLSQEQVDPLVEEILGRFPNVKMADYPEYSGLFKQNLVSLGLNLPE